MYVTHGSKSHIITISSSLPLANHRPEWAHRTTSTGPVCIVRVLSDFGGLPDNSDAWLRMGFVLQMRTLASSPPVAIREPSGWTWQENIETRFSSPRMAESAGRMYRNAAQRTIANQRPTFVHDP